MDRDALLRAFSRVDAGGGSAEALSDEEFRRGLYPLASQARSFEPDRILIVGGRGTGKTEIFRALLSEEGRRAVVRATGVHLTHDVMRMVLVEAFGAGKAMRPNAPPHPAADAIEELLREHDIGVARRLWLGLSLARLSIEESARPLLPPEVDRDLAALRSLVSSPREVLRWIEQDVERPFAILDRIDRHLVSRSLVCVFTFDALDRAANGWTLLELAVGGLLSLALDLQRRSRALRLKVFLRPDLESSGARSFPDASKLRGYREELSWNRSNLYRLLFKLAANDPADGSSAYTFLRSTADAAAFRDDPWLGRTPTLTFEESSQARVIELLVGKYMGTDRRRGRTYAWVPNHLQDAYGRVSPRSFLVAWGEAARWVQSQPTDTWPGPITPNALGEGVKAASQRRVDELTEDFPWIEQVATHLDGLEVPCPESKVLACLRDCQFGEGGQRRSLRSAEPASVLQQLVELGVFFKHGDRYNVPDLYRVAMRMKRRGGIKLAR